MKLIHIVIVLALLTPTVALARIQPIEQSTLTNMAEQELVLAFGAAIQTARQTQNDFVKSRGRRAILSMIPVVGAGVTIGAAGKVGDLQVHKIRLLQLKREMRARFPVAWEATKGKWGIDDRYLE